MRIIQLAREGSPPPRFCLSQAELSRKSNQAVIVHMPPGGVQLDMEPADDPEPVLIWRSNGQNNSKLAEIFDRASSFSALVGIAVDVVSSFMALLSFVESSPRA